MRGFPFIATDPATPIGANGMEYLPPALAGWLPTLLVAHFARGEVYTVSLPGGQATAVALTCRLPRERACGPGRAPGAPLMGNADGLWVHAGRRGRVTIYVANPRSNTVTTVALGRRFHPRTNPVGAVVAQDTDGAFQGPTTLTAAAGWLYAVNLQFGKVPPGADLATDLTTPSLVALSFEAVRHVRLWGREARGRGLWH